MDIKSKAWKKFIGEFPRADKKGSSSKKKTTKTASH